MECKTNPVELVLATKDEKLYDSEGKKWKWSGTLYWIVACLNNNQTSVADIKAPNYPEEKYVPIDENPISWDFCGSNCNIQSQSLHVVFTFKPLSKDPKDFLQFVVNPYCKVTDRPLHFILDDNENAVYFNIVQVDKMSKKPYVELWIEFTTAEQGELTIPEEGTPLPSEIGDGTILSTGGNMAHLYIFLICLVGVIFIAALIFYIVRQ